jgi:hypothetical protein
MSLGRRLKNERSCSCRRYGTRTSERRPRDERRSCHWLEGDDRRSGSVRGGAALGTVGMMSVRAWDCCPRSADLMGRGCRKVRPDWGDSGLDSCGRTAEITASCAAKKAFSSFQNDRSFACVRSFGDFKPWITWKRRLRACEQLISIAVVSDILYPCILCNSVECLMKCLLPDLQLGCSAVIDAVS